MRVGLPGALAVGEAVLRDEPAIDPVRLVARGVGGVPFHAGELGFHAVGGAEAEVGGVGGEVGHLETGRRKPPRRQERQASTSHKN